MVFSRIVRHDWQSATRFFLTLNSVASLMVMERCPRHSTVRFQTPEPAAAPWLIPVVGLINRHHPLANAALIVRFICSALPVQRLGALLPFCLA